jgi:hypothetical protein
MGGSAILMQTSIRIAQMSAPARMATACEAFSIMIFKGSERSTGSGKTGAGTAFITALHVRGRNSPFSPVLSTPTRGASVSVVFVSVLSAVQCRCGMDNPSSHADRAAPARLTLATHELHRRFWHAAPALDRPNLPLLTQGFRCCQATALSVRVKTFQCRHSTGANCAPVKPSFRRAACPAES